MAHSWPDCLYLLKNFAGRGEHVEQAPHERSHWLPRLIRRQFRRRRRLVHMEAFSDDLQDVENMAQCPAIRSQKSEVGGQRSEVRSQRSFRHSSFVIRQFGFPIALRIERRYFWRGLSGGVMVAQGPLEA